MLLPGVADDVEQLTSHRGCGPSCAFAWLRTVSLAARLCGSPGSTQLPLQAKGTTIAASLIVVVTNLPEKQIAEVGN